MPKPNKQIIIDEIIQEIKKKQSYTATLGVNGGKWGLTPSTFDRYWKIANEQHRQAQEPIIKELSDLDKKEAIKAHKSGLNTKFQIGMDLQEQIQVMQNQLKGLSQFTFTVGNKILNSHTNGVFMLPVQVQNEIRAKILNFSSEISKLEGYYQPTKIAQTNTQGEDVAPMIVLNQFMGAAIDIKESE